MTTYKCEGGKGCMEPCTTDTKTGNLEGDASVGPATCILDPTGMIPKTWAKEEGGSVNRDCCKDSSQFGTAGKGGAFKVYYDATKPEEADGIITDAIERHIRGKEQFDEAMGL